MLWFFCIKSGRYLLHENRMSVIYVWEGYSMTKRSVPLNLKILFIIQQQHKGLWDPALSRVCWKTNFSLLVSEICCVCLIVCEEKWENYSKILHLIICQLEKPSFNFNSVCDYCHFDLESFRKRNRINSNIDVIALPVCIRSCPLLKIFWIGTIKIPAKLYFSTFSADPK